MIAGSNGALAGIKTIADGRKVFFKQVLLHLRVGKALKNRKALCFGDGF
ncbi:hypothetical protein O9929_12170 [Vibrio lentus]|nr:hypothetical protein [Vibrio lentus]